MATAKKQPSAVEVMRSHGPGRRPGGRPCGSCVEPWKEEIHNLLKVATEEMPEKSLRQLWEYLKEVGYPLGVGALDTHLHNHEPTLRRRWSEQHQKHSG